MTSSQPQQNQIFRATMGEFTTATLVALFIVFLAAAAHAQTFTALHKFAGGQDGANPQAGLTMDGGGNLYGTSYYGGNQAGR